MTSNAILCRPVVRRPNVLMSSKSRKKPGFRGKTNPSRGMQFSTVTPNSIIPQVKQKLYRCVKLGHPFGLVQGQFDSFSDFSFQVTDLAENGAFAIMFVEYRIISVTMTFRPMYRANAIINESTSGLIPQIYLVFDPTNGTLPSSVSDYQRYQALVVHDDSSAVTIAFAPKAQEAIYNGILTTAYSPKLDSGWISTSYLGVPHYGAHVAISGSGVVAEGQHWNVSVSYSIAFRGNR